MYTRAEVERQIKTKKSWTGKQVAVYKKINYLEDMIADNMQHIPQI